MRRKNHVKIITSMLKNGVLNIIWAIKTMIKEADRKEKDGNHFVVHECTFFLLWLEEVREHQQNIIL